MTATIGFNPYTTTNASGLFAIQSDGFVQGMAQDDPVYRNWLAGGVLASTETLPMWGGVGIFENLNISQIPLANDNNVLGNSVGRATNVTTGAASQLAGFSVFNQSYASPITTNSPVPLTPSGVGVNFYRLGSKARIPVAIAPGLIATLGSGSIVQQVSWDFVGQQLLPYQPAYATATASSGTYTSSTGVLQLTFGSAPAGTAPTVDAYFDVTSITGTGNGSQLVGNWQLISSASSGTVLNLQAPVGLGAITITGSTGTIAAGGGALPCKVLQVQGTNCKMVSYNATTNSATWNNNGAAALIEI
jgi:hypothetical protein